MLVLSRRAREEITIGDNAEITIRVLEVRGNQVKIGIEAPRGIVVDRGEIHRSKLRERFADTGEEPCPPTP